MPFDPGVRIGEEIDNDRLCEIFKCSTQGGMRRSTRTETLVLVSNHVESLYNDRWIGSTLHYTGMGRVGDQSLDFMQNKTLAQSASTGVDIHLFEVNRPQTYTYIGRVQLAGNAYQEDQIDEEGGNRKVWVFPLTVVSGQVPVISVEDYEKREDQAKRLARRLSDEEIRARAARGRALPSQRQVIGIRYERDPYVAENAKRRANGVCELCGIPAPFKNREGDPYLETHHILWLSKGGDDTDANTVALCPNCHRRMHILDSVDDRGKLREHLGGRSRT